MKLHIREWQHVINALNKAEAMEKDRCDLASATKDRVGAGQAYTQAERYRLVREKIEGENLG